MTDVTTDTETKNEETTVEVEVETATEEENNVEVLDAASKETDSSNEEETITIDSKDLKLLEEFKEKYYYLAAEMDNVRKRFSREKENLLKFGSEKILSSLLDVVDNLERTSAALANDEDEKVVNIVTGVNMVHKQFLDVLKNNGLEEVESVGKIFDPNFHEAMAQQPSEDKEDQEIIQEYQKGYVLNGRLLRAAKVVVATNPNKKK